MPVTDHPDEKAWMLATLKELTEVGMEMARGLQAGVRQAGGEASADAALKFSRISRAVRQTVGLYGLVLENKLAETAARRSGSAGPRPPPQKDIEVGAKVRDTAVYCAECFIEHIAPPEAIDAFQDEIAEWRADVSFDPLYAKSDNMTVTAEIFLMLGLTVPKGLNYHREFKQLLDDTAAGKDQPWREAWEFLQGRERPHFAHFDTWDPSKGPIRRGQPPPGTAWAMAKAEDPDLGRPRGGCSYKT